jgi:hypothetical protein
MTRFINIIGTLAVACVLCVGTVPAPASAQVSVGLSVTFGPPAIPYYAQPPAPGPNWIWQPGYWAWGPYGYYWVPGTWVVAPAVGLYWTPGYWAFTGGVYAWDPGYWGPVVGFYGGINYGFGYFGSGFVGGRWSGNYFHYNTAITNVNVAIVHNNVYHDPSVYRSWRGGYTSFNGGPHGVQARPTAYQQHAYSQRRYGMTAQQTAHANYARTDPSNRYNSNHGRPSVASVQRPWSSSNTPSAYHATAAHAASHAAPQHAASQHAAPQHAAVEHHAAPQHAAPQHAAPQHAAPQHAAPQHAAPVEHHAAPVEHHAAPAAQHEYYQPHAQSAPQHAYQPAAHPQSHPAPQYHPASHPAPQSHQQPQGHPQGQGHPAPHPSRGPRG